MNGVLGRDVAVAGMRVQMLHHGQQDLMVVHYLLLCDMLRLNLLPKCCYRAHLLGVDKTEQL